MSDWVSNRVSTGYARTDREPEGTIFEYKIWWTEGIRTPDLLNAIPTVDRPLESTRVAFEFGLALNLVN